MVLDLFEESSIFGEDKVDRSSLSAESASAANSVNVVLLRIFGSCAHLIDFLWRLFEVRLIW